MGTSMIICILALLCGQSRAAFEWVPPHSVCQSSHEPDPMNAATPRMPQLPSQYSMKVEANILQKSWSTEVEEHFDSVNKRASISLSFNGTTTVSIFNFQAGERYDIYPDGTCHTRSVEIDYYGFTSLGKQNRTIMATVNQVFHFGSQFKQTYVGKETVRGIAVNHWTSCQEWTEFGAKFQLDYYFSVPDFTTAAGRSEIPIRAVLNGTARNMSASSQQPNATHQFFHMYEFSSFRIGPVLNEQVFQLPAGIVCPGRRHDKPFPKLPETFQMSMETVLPGGSLPPLWQSVRYDYSHRLVETWYTRNIARAGQFISHSFSTLEDYASGLVYIMDKTNMSCHVLRLPPNKTSLDGQNLLMLTPASSAAFIYQGQSRLRQMTVDVWAMESQGVTLEVFFLPQSTVLPHAQLVGMLIKKQTSEGQNLLPPVLQEAFPSDLLQWPQDSSFNLSSHSSITGDQCTWGQHLPRLPQKLIHVFHFQPVLTDMSNFQASLCYHENQTSRIMLIVHNDYSADVLSNFVPFTNSIRNAIAKKVGVSLVQISYLIPLHVTNEVKNMHATQVSFTLLGSALVAGTQQKPIGQLKKDLEKAIQLGISFTVHYPSHSQDFIVDKTLYALDYNGISLKNLTFPGLFSKTWQVNAGVSYSPGAVAGIAFCSLLVGAGLCVGGLFLLFRLRRRGQQFSLPYQMTA